MLHIAAAWATRRGLMAAAILAIGSTSPAHEFWIEPATFGAAVDSVVPVNLMVGDGFPGHPVIRDRAAIERFVIAGPSGTADVAGWDGRHPAGLIRVRTAGTHVIGYLSRGETIELDAARFESYLREDGLEPVIEERRRRGASLAPGRERFVRCAKAILCVGPAPEPGFDHALDLPLELLPEEDPTRAGDGRLVLRLLHRGAPRGGVLVAARHRDRPGHLARARTDDAGRVTLALDAPGVWLVSGVHMVAAPPGQEVDWESLWASLTFQREAPAAVD
jgi:hypothetical protein